MSRFFVFGLYHKDVDCSVEVNLRVSGFQATVDTEVPWEAPARMPVGQNSFNKCRRFNAYHRHGAEERHYSGGVNVNSTCTSNYSWSDLLNAETRR